MLNEMPIDRDRHQVRKFRCGQQALDDWLRSASFKAEATGTCRTYVLVEDIPATGKAPVIAYYSLAATAITFEEIHPEDRAELPRYPIPAALIARLAVDQAHQGKGLAGALLAKATSRILIAAQQVGITMIVVDAIDAKAAAFYRHYGFSQTPSEPHRLYIASAQLHANLNKE